ncbi:MAG: EAL domain-containing protein [Proteobacteria bacterium]|nr:EAL domain-containing protein [Pseudomonadota bacterium]
MIFGGDLAYPPFEWIEGGRPVGFNVELERAVAESGGAVAEHRLGNWPDIVNALRNGDVDVVPMFRSTEREKEFVFTSAIYYVHHSIYASPESPAVFSPYQLHDATVAVEEMSYAHQRIIEEGLPFSLSLQPNTLEALKAVAVGKADYALLAVPVTDELIRKHDLSIKRSDSLLWPREYGFAVRADRVELAEWLRENLAMTIADGRYGELYEAWEARLKGQHETLLLRLRDALVVIVPVFLLMALAALWAWTLRRTVRVRTAELQSELKHREAAEEALSFAANHNTRSSLPLSHHFMALVDERLRHCNEDRQAELRILELTDLPRISRTFGYEVADKALHSFAGRVRSADYAVAGDFGRGVFAIFAERRSTKGWFAVLAEPIIVGDLEFHPSLAGGSAYWPGDGTSAVQLVKRAETALAVSRAQGRSWCRYESSMEPDKMDVQIIADFRKSSASSLTLALQPQLDLKTGALCGAEALVRWNHPTYGFISPERFIPLLESAGLIEMVTRRMVGEAIRVAGQLYDLGLEIPVSVNVSAQDFAGDTLVTSIKGELDRQNSPGHRLKVELTETSVADDPERVRLALEELSRMGVSASIDDFGTGYSSLSYLSAYPVEEIKIDREFVDGMSAAPKKLSIVRSTVALAKELGLKTVAEGAEDDITIQMLKDIGCDKVQGFVISKPLAEDAFYEFVVKHEQQKRFEQQH